MIEGYECRFCGCRTFTKGEMRAASGFFSSLFDVQSSRFDTATCNECGHTELFKRNVGTATKILDFFTN